MGKIVVIENVTLDGVMQAPAAADEDTRGGFAHGGWGRQYADRAVAAEMGLGGSPNDDGAMLFGRRTYEHLCGVWSEQTDGNPFTEVLNRRRKYVVSGTLTEPLPWENSTLLKGDAVAALKRDVKGDLVVLGSGELVRSLAAAGLVDLYRLAIHPLTLDSGARLFAYGMLELVKAVPMPTGVIVATYRPAA